MKISIETKILTIFLLLFLGSAQVYAEVKEKYTFGVFPYNSARKMISFYGPVAKDFATTINAKVKLKSATSFDKFTQNLEREIYDIALIQPFDYPNAITMYNYVPLARVNASLSAYFVVLEDSNIHSLSDLKNKTIAFPPAPAAISHLAESALIKAGLRPNKDVKIKYYKSHDSCLHEVLIRKASACPTDFTNINVFQKNSKIKFRILKQTQKLPHILFVGHKRLSHQTLMDLKNQIISWSDTSKGKLILKNLGMPGFIEVKEKDYAAIFELNRPVFLHENRKRPDSLNFGAFPYIPAKKLAIRLAPLPLAFAKVLNHDKIKLRTASSYKQFNLNITQGVYDIVLMQPFDYADAIKQGYLPLAQLSFDVTAHIFINKNSNIRSFNDLIGKTIASPPRLAAVSRLIIAKIRQSGLWVGKDIIVNYRKSHLSCYKELRARKASACISGPIAYASLPAEISENIELLEITHAVPGVLFMVHSRMSKKQRLVLKNTILDWHNHPAGKKLLKQTGLKRFIEVETQRYEEIFNRTN